jgi:signal transduction histidine kinase/CheY-like chemotaxis protein
MRALRGLRFRLPLIVLLTGAAYVVVDSWIEQSVRLETVRRSVLAHVTSVAGGGAADLAAAVKPDPGRTRAYLRERAAEVPRPELVALVDAAGRIVASEPPAAPGTPVASLLGPTWDAVTRGRGARDGAGATLLPDRRAVGVGRVPSGPLAGVRFVVAVDARERLAMVAGGIRAQSLPGVALGLAIVALLAWLLERWLHTPSRRLQEAAERIAAGDRSARANLRGDDEIARAGAAFDHMADEVARTEHELVAAQRRLDAVLQALPVGVSVISRDDGRLLFINPRLLELMGIAPESVRMFSEVVGRLRIRRLDGSPIPMNETATARAMATGEIATASDLVMTRPDGVDVPHIAHAVPISLLSEGESDAVVTVIQDQRELIRLSEEVHLWKRRYERVVEATAQVVYEWDLVTGEVHRSSNGAVVLGYAIGEGGDALATWSSRLHPEDRDRISAELELCVRSGKPFQAEYRLRHGQGHWITIHEQGFFDLGPGGRPVAMYGTMTDVTAQRAVEAQLRQAQKMETIGTMAGGIAHDFNNQLTGLIGHLDLLHDTLPGGDASLEHVRIARAAAERCADLTRGLLAAGRRLESRPQSASLNALVEETARLLRRALPVTVKLETDLAPGLPPALIGSGQIQQALINLCLNASDAMPAGGLVRVATRAAAPPDGATGAFVELSVRDSGEGIAPEALPRIFEPFFTTKPLGKGTGLGLSMAYGIVSKHGGRIEVENHPGEGACFRVLLPAATTAPAEPAAASSGLPRPGRGECVLVVDDEPVVRTLAVRTLEGAGYRVVSAGGADEAVELLRAQAGAVRAALLDVMMPGRTGLQVLPDLRRINPGLCVVLTSGYSSEVAPAGDARTAFLPKPFTPYDLIEAVRAALETARVPLA